jgi:hypothetical protein
MTFIKRLSLSGAIGLLIGLVAQVGYIGCYFNETLARLFLVPLLYVAFWPSFLLDLFDPKRSSGAERGPLGIQCLISLAGYLVAAVLLAVIDQAVRSHRRRGVDPVVSPPEH